MSPVRVRLLALVPPLLLTVFALFGVWQHVVHDQSSWSGASFGMFATIDGAATRQLRAYVEDGNSRVPLRTPSELEREAARVRVLPTVERLTELGERWVEAAPPGAGGVLVLEVWGIEFDADDAILSRFLIRRTEVSL